MPSFGTRWWIVWALAGVALVALAGCSNAQPTPTLPAAPKPAAVPTSPLGALATPPVTTAVSPAARAPSPASPSPSPSPTRGAAIFAASPSATATVVGRFAPATGPTVRFTTNAQLGMILTDGNGRTLYYYTRDQANTSNCRDQCAQTWPPLLVAGQPTPDPGVTGMVGAITRPDGGRQVTYNELPLYYFVRDTQPGDATGEGVGNVWYVVRPDTRPGATPPAR